MTDRVGVAALAASGGTEEAAAAASPAAIHARELKSRAAALGFSCSGVVALPAALRAGYFRAWLAAGRHGDMHWLARAPERRLDPELVLPGARALFVCGYPYLQEEPPRRGRIAKYALGRDYHNLLLRKLKVLCGWLRAQGGVNRPYVDTGPLLEKELGALAGIGWIGKNTVLLNPREGQWLLLGCILTTLELAADAPVADRCGTCTRCIDVCPTGAITAPYQLDARRCISYLTIEHRGPIPEELRPLIGDHLFGCDDCLDVCPWNRWALASHEAAFAVRDYPDPGAMLDWDAAAFAAATAGTPLRRTGLARWKRNVSVVLGNTGAASDLPALDRAAADPDPLVAEHARWAAARIRGRAKTEGCKP